MSEYIDYRRLAATHRAFAARYRAKATAAQSPFIRGAHEDMAAHYEAEARRCDDMRAQGARVRTWATIEARRAAGVATIRAGER